MASVSVIIPCYNQGHYLKRTLTNVIAQEYSDWEAIVVDDGSTDDTASAAKTLGDRRIRYHYQANRGLSGARNAGLERSRGRYLTFLDADDEWEPGFLARCVSVLDGAPEAPGVYTQNSFLDAQGRRLDQIGGANIGQGDFRRRLLEGGFFPPCAVMVRQEAVLAAGSFDTALTSVEDWDLWLRISRHGNMIGVQEPLARYRVYTGSMSTDVERMHANRLAVLEKHFGPATGEISAWEEEKRYGYAFAHRATGLAFMEQGRSERCWEEMEMAASYWPAILGRLDTYYELGCGRHSKGYRGRQAVDEIEVNGDVIVAWLDDFFSRATVDLQRQRRPAFGQAYLALAMLAEQAGDWHLGRRYSRRALLANPRLATVGGVMRRIAKLHVGQGLTNALRPANGSQTATLDPSSEDTQE